MKPVKIVSIFVLYSFVVFTVTSGGEISVNTTNGVIIGSEESVQIVNGLGATEDRQFRQFLGIPYAEPPTGDLRFRKPQPKAPWTNPYNATIRRPICFQGDGPLTKVAQTVNILNSEQSEDCLTLDIYTPTTGSGPYAVMLFLHGEIGGANGYIGDVLAVVGNIIVVVVNYRVSLFGFFSTDDDVSPGNYGLWDQHMAIKWVHENINTFQGDTSRITVTGSTIGASYAIYQSMYAGNVGLFSRVIAQSGSPILCPCKKSSSLRTPDPKLLAKAMGCGDESSSVITDCLRQKSLTEVHNALMEMTPSVTFTPVVDRKFILGDPKSIMESNDSASQGARDMFSSVNMVTGINNREGGTHVVLIWSTLLDQPAETFHVSRSEFSETVVPTVMNLVYKKNVSKAVENLVVYEYSDILEPENTVIIRDKTVDLSTDIDLAVPTLETVTFHAKQSSLNTYLYELSANTSISTPLTPSWLAGANHGDEVYFLFGFSDRFLKAWSHTQTFTPTDDEIKTSRRLMMLWSNFIKTGDPNSPNAEGDPWPKFDPVTSSYAEISHMTVSNRKYFREPAMTFWTQVVPNIMEQTYETSQPEGVSTVSVMAEQSDRLHMSFLLSENIIILLIIISSCLLIAYILLCLFSITRSSSKKYMVNLKVV